MVVLLVIGAFVWREPRDAAPAVARHEAPPSSAKERNDTPDTRRPLPASFDHATRIRQAGANGTTWAEVQDLLDELAREDPRLALQLAEELGPDERRRYLVMRDIVDRWARRDAGAALNWSIAQFRRWDGMEASFPYLVLQRAALGDPARAIALTQETLAQWSRHPGADAGELAYTAINALAASGDDGEQLARAAIEHWAGAGLIEEVGRDAIERVAGRMADESLPDAIAWLQQLPAAEARNDALANVVARWAEQEPAVAAAWAETLDAAQGRDEVLRRTLAAWAGADALAAANWIAERERDSAADPILAEISARSALATENPDAALKFAALIENPSLRSASIDSILVEWHERDAAAATDYVARHDRFAPGERARLLQMMRNP